MIAEIAAVVAGLALLAWASEHFVIGAARVSLVANVSPVVVGAVVIGFGTSAPELLASVIAAAQGARDLAIGNVVGSNTANVTLVLGFAALLAPAAITSETLRREAPLSLGAVLLLAVVLRAGASRPAALLLIAATAAVLVVLLRSARPDREFAHDVEDVIGEPAAPPLRTEVVRTVVGLAGTVAGAQLLVTGAVRVAERAGLREGFVGFTLVAVGTSLPELITAYHAARRGETDLVVGNVLGSNIFNSLAIAGLVMLVAPGRLTDPRLAGLGLALMTGCGAAAFVFMYLGRAVRRWEAALLVAAWVAALPFLA